jgi:hypothetical protein
MDAKELQRLKTAKPFEPFRLVMSDGAVYDVVGPEWFDVGTKSSYLKIPSTDEPELLDYMLRLANDHIIPNCIDP